MMLHRSNASAQTMATKPTSEPRISLDALARSICAFIILLVLVLDVLSIPAAYRLLQTPCGPCDPNSIQATTLETQGLTAAGFDLRIYALYTVSLIAITQFTYIGLGVLVFLRRADDRMALFTSLTLVTFGGAAFTGTMHALAPIDHALWLLTASLNIIGQSSFIVFLYVFPDGRFTPRWTILPAILWSLSWIFTIAPVPIVGPIASAMQDGALFLGLLLSMIVAQVYRYQRVSTQFQRQQTKWAVYGLGVGLSGFATTLVVSNLLLPQSLLNSPLGVMLGNTLTYACFLVIPIGIAIAVLRSRLYDIDILINRTLVYGSLTAILAALYFGLVIGAQLLTQAVTNHKTDQQPFVIVLTTLVIAALVQPLRRRLQRTIDQRFYRSRYDATRTVAAFSASLRNEVNLQQLNEHLLQVVVETMRPTQVSLWLRPTTKPSRREE